MTTLTLTKELDGATFVHTTPQGRYLTQAEQAVAIDLPLGHCLNCHHAHHVVHAAKNVREVIERHSETGPKWGRLKVLEHEVGVDPRERRCNCGCLDEARVLARVGGK